MGMRQGNRSVADYAIDFSRARESSWSSAFLCKTFVFSLADYIKDELPTTLNSLIQLATWIDLRIQPRRQEHTLGPPRRSHLDLSSRPNVALTHDRRNRTSRNEPQPMQVRRFRLSLKERCRNMEQELCPYYGQAAHFLPTCMLKDKAHHYLGK